VLGPTVAGRWYPADRAELERQVDGLLASGPGLGDPGAAAAPEATVAPTALIAPHAGYLYSGAVAAAAFGRLGTSAPPRRVIVMGPSHFAAFEGAALPRAGRYRTPLGEIPLDEEAVARLEEGAAFRVDDRPFLPEHALEAELPFLQRLLPDWRLLPVLIGAGSSAAALDAAAAALAELWNDETLLVVSSDFTHYGSSFGFVPFTAETDDVPARIEALDRGAIDRIVALDRAGFADYVTETGATICGQAPIRILLRLAAGRAVAELAAYDTSGRITGSWDHSVSYAGIVFRPGDGAS
jgi:AmmeMemoRadiSam system protein B